MKFTETKLKGAYVIELDEIGDSRGFFARSWCQEEFATMGLNSNLVQCNISFNLHEGTLRGMHYQIAPYEEAKLVRCTAGAIHDVIIDLRPSSETYKMWVAIELTAKNRKGLYIPEGIAHGFQTLEDYSEVFYQMSEFYHSESARGVKWDDLAFSINWPPCSSRVISDRDLGYANFES
jgi:dTDP-4-dehydrorhamnose 3,5-epimerase